jgi:cell division septation protein DedD
LIIINPETGTKWFLLTSKTFIMRQLSAICLVLLLVVAPSCKFFNKKEKARAMAALQAKQDSIRVVDSIKAVQEELMAIENAKLEAAKKAEEEAALKAKNKYNIVVGSFKTPEYARNCAEAYRKQGYNPTIIKMEGSTFELVVAESHESVRKAVERQREFQNNIEKDAWVYIIK